MTLTEKMGLRGEITNLPRVRNPKEIMTSAIVAQVENKPQLLRSIRPFRAMSGDIPASLSENAKFALLNLFSCFEKHGVVKEGLVDDLLWGFEQAGIDLKRVAYGLVDLQRAGFISFQAPDGANVDENCRNLRDCWIRYETKLTDLVCSG